MSPSTANFSELVPVLVNAGVEFVLIEGGAAVVHGSARVTVDVLYRRSDKNHERLAVALEPFQPYLRGAPPGLPFTWDQATIEHGLNFTLSTDLGDIDLLGAVPGGTTYEDVEPDSFVVDAFGVKFACVTLRKLIRLKQAAGRPKDLEVLAELQHLLDQQSADG